MRFLPSVQWRWQPCSGRAPRCQLSSPPYPIRWEAAIADMAREPGGGLVVPPDNFSYVHRELIFALAARHRLPVVYPFRFMAREGGLVSYGVDLGETFPRAAEYIDRILKGAKPADLPVQAPTKFELVISLKTAKALGIDLPATVLARADEVIE